MELPEPTARNALRLLQYLSERERRREAELPEIPEISEVIGLTPDDTIDLIDILDSEGAIKAIRSIDGGAAPMLTGRGKLMLEVLSEELGAKGAVVTDVRDELCTLPPGPNAEDAQAPPAPKSESSPEPQEFVPSPDYRRVDWRGKKFLFSPMQSHVVRLLHEEFQRGRGELGNTWVLERVGSHGKYLRDIFRRHGAWGTLVIEGENKGTHKLSLSH